MSSCGFLALPSPPARISIAPSETVAALLLLLAYAALFVCGARLLRTRGRRRPFVIVVFASALGQILWAGGSASPKGVCEGFFVNPDHFAGYLEIGLALAFGVLWAEVLTSHDRVIDVDRIDPRGSSAGSPPWGFESSSGA